MKPLVSVIIPTYNRRGLVDRAIKSVLDQTYKKVEIIVVDDGSTDATSRAVFPFVQEHENVRYYYKNNGGCASALNYGLKRAKGELICWLSSDDWYEPEMLEKSVAEHVKDKSLGMTYTTYHAVRDGGKEFRESYQPKNRDDAIKEIEKWCFINGSSIMVKRDVFYNIGPFNENFKYAQDYDFYYRVLYNYRVKLIDEPLLNYWDGQDKDDPAWLGKEVFARTHTNEGEPVRERYRLMYEKGRQKVCAMICVKDEEELIGQCLDDLSMYVDYIVVFNDGSTDRTLEIVKKYDKVVEIHNAKPKQDARTEGKDRQLMFDMAKKTKADWILMIDADEVMEDTFKTEIWKEIADKNVNLYHYRSYNFWRNTHQYRIDELWFKGWFGKLFRNLPGLKYNTGVNEHCGSVPMNIPGAPQWFNPESSKNARKSEVRIKHYGYADWNRVERKYLALMVRDAKPPEGRHIRYDRMVTEDGMVREPWIPRVYYLPEGVGFEKKEEKPAPPPKPVKKGKKFLFVGRNGSGASMIAAKLAKDRGFEADSVGIIPDKEILPAVVEILQDEGVVVGNARPSNLSDKKDEFYDCIVLMDPSFHAHVKPFRPNELVKWVVRQPRTNNKDAYKEVYETIKGLVEELK